MHRPTSILDPSQSAKEVGLRYVSDTQPGISRRRRGRSFTYIGPDGSLLRDAETLVRIKSLVIPPAWSNVWICTNPKGHLQVTGRDAKGRKQSKYHARWREVRDETKYERMLMFGVSLPVIREQVDHDLSAPGMPRQKVLATVVRLMETTFIRVGNEEYARENNSYGLTTMRNRHVAINGSRITFKFQGKSGVCHSVDITDGRLARIVQRCQDIPGYELFQYIDSEGEHHTIDSADVNDYLREVSRQDFTAKDFRTWAGTLIACTLLREFAKFESETQAKKNIVQVIKRIAVRLGNTPSVCRKCYVHPAVLEYYLNGEMIRSFKMKNRRTDAGAGRLWEQIQRNEKALMRLLRNDHRDS